MKELIKKIKQIIYSHGRNRRFRAIVNSEVLDVQRIFRRIPFFGDDCGQFNNANNQLPRLPTYYLLQMKSSKINPQDLSVGYWKEYASRIWVTREEKESQLRVFKSCANLHSFRNKERLNVQIQAMTELLEDKDNG